MFPRQADTLAHPSRTTTHPEEAGGDAFVHGRPHLAFEMARIPEPTVAGVQACGKLKLPLLQDWLIDLHLPMKISEGT